MSEETKTLPKEWKLVKLGEAANVLNSLRKPINTRERNKRIENKPTSELYPYYGATGQVGWIDGFLSDGEYVLLGEDGAPFFDIGKTKAYEIKGKGWVNNHAHVLDAIEGITFNRFLLHYLNAFNYKGYVNGTTRLKLTKGSLIRIPVPLPPLATQEAIVAKIETLFSELDNGIAQLKTAQQQLDTYRQSVLKWAFEGKLTNKNVKDGELPKGWEWVKLGALMEAPKYGTSKKCDYDITGKAVLRIPNINDGYIDLQDLKYANFDIKEIETYSLKQGDILIIRSNGSKDLVGRCALVQKKDEGCLYAGYLIRLRLLNSVQPKYILNVLRSGLLRIQIEMKARSTSGVNNINSQEIKMLDVPLPCIEEQSQIIQEIESRLSVADKLQETITTSLAQAESLRQSILKQAFEGRLV